MSAEGATKTVVVVGTGQGGFQVGMSLRDNGFNGPITLVGDEAPLPYQRPPLSKTYLAGSSDMALLTLRPPSFYAAQEITVRTGSSVVAIDRVSQTTVLESGDHLPYSHLVLALGAQPIKLGIPGSGLEGVLMLRTVADAEALRCALVDPVRVVVIGGGFIGMEVASSATMLGHDVTVVETAKRIMERVVAPEVSSHVAATQCARGVKIIADSSAVALHGKKGRVSAVELASGTRIPSDVVVVGIGVRPNVQLAAAANLKVSHGPSGGIVVDDQLRTSDLAISAIGDCASYPSIYSLGPARLESVQNAVDQARHVAARLTGRDRGSYTAVPWFWSHQFDLNIQIAGIGGGDDARVVLGDPNSGKFSVARFARGQLICVESINSPGDHMASRRLLAGLPLPAMPQVSEVGFSLKEYVRDIPRASVAD